MKEKFRMIWSGKAVGKNKKLIRTKKSLFRNSKYKEFVQEMSNQFKLQGTEIKGDVKVIMKICCHHLADHHNFIEPILDGMQNSGCIENDRNVAELILIKPRRHKNGVADELDIEVEKIDV